MDLEKDLKSSTKKHRYNFHDIVSFQLLTDDALAESYIEAEYLPHEGVSHDARLPEVCLYFQRKEGVFQIPNGYTHYSYQRLARLACKLRITPDRIVIEAIGNRAAIPMIQHLLILPSLRYLASHRGVILLHSSAAAHNNHSLIFSGRSEVGKSAICSLIMSFGDANWSMHANEYVFLGMGEASLSYMTRLHIYWKLVKMVPKLTERLGLRERVQLNIFGRIRLLSSNHIRWPIHKDIQEMWPARCLCMSAIPAALLILRHAKITEPAIYPIKDIPGLVDELVELNFGEAKHYINLVKKSRAVSDSAAWLSAWKKREQMIIEYSLANIPAYQLHIPEIRPGPDDLDSHNYSQPALLKLLTGLAENDGVLLNSIQPGRNT